MIRLIQEGRYDLYETSHDTRMLLLDKAQYAWIKAENIGDILVMTSAKSFPKNIILASGNFRLYKVKDEPDFTDLLHLELHAGKGSWQGYLLPLGLPNTKNKRRRIVPTDEIITRSV